MYVCVCVYECMCVYVFMYVCVCVCMYVCMYVCVCVPFLYISMQINLHELHTSGNHLKCAGVDFAQSNVRVFTDF